jgi:site-specific DNA-cytosine methylase
LQESRRLCKSDLDGAAGPKQCRQRFACDNSKYVEHFVLKNHEPDSYYKSMSDLQKTVAFCMKKKEITVVPRVDNAAIGWVCKTASLMNNNRDVSCIQTASGQTGETFLNTNQYLGELHGPDTFVGENVGPLLFNFAACVTSTTYP